MAPSGVFQRFHNFTMHILGISCFYHDSAACLVADGVIIAAAQEERFSRVKHDADFPKKAIAYCLAEGNITIDDVDAIVFYDKPFLKFERLLESYLVSAPRGLRSYLTAIPQWVKKKLWVTSLIEKELGYKGKVLYTEHHQSHAASAFFPSSFSEAAILTIDGVGEWTTTSWGVGKDNNITIKEELYFPHSLGLFYSAFTYYTGFRVNSGEYKMMGLAPYGKPKYVDLIYKHLIDVKDDGSFHLHMDYFDYVSGLAMVNKKFWKLFGGPPRKPEGPVTQKEMDIAASVQRIVEDMVLKIARYVYQQSGQKNLCLAGGVALNCVANGRLSREGLFDDIWIQPAAGDAGGALGAALSAWHTYYGKERVVKGKDSQYGSYLGPHFKDKDIKEFLNERELPYEHIPDPQFFDRVAKYIADEKVVGWFSGRMEYGPRALGARSILGDARSTNMQKILNLKIKFRESFRPFAPSILEDHASEYFDLATSSPYMLLVAPVSSAQRKSNISVDTNEQESGMKKLHEIRSTIPSVTHVDYSARVQTVARDTHPRYYALIQAIEHLTGYPVVVNTSFNVRGEPIVCTPQDAYTCFMRTDMDYLVLGNYILDKQQQPLWHEDKDWRKMYDLD